MIRRSSFQPLTGPTGAPYSLPAAQVPLPQADLTCSLPGGFRRVSARQACNRWPALPDASAAPTRPGQRFMLLEIVGIITALGDLSNRRTRIPDLATENTERTEMKSQGVSGSPFFSPL